MLVTFQIGSHCESNGLRTLATLALIFIFLCMPILVHLNIAADIVVLTIFIPTALIAFLPIVLMAFGAVLVAVSLSPQVGAIVLHDFHHFYPSEGVIRTLTLLGFVVVCSDAPRCVHLGIVGARS